MYINRMRLLFALLVLAMLGCAGNKPSVAEQAYAVGRCSALFEKPVNFNETNYTEVPENVECVCLKSITCNAKEYCELIDCPGYTNPYLSQ